MLGQIIRLQLDRIGDASRRTTRSRSTTATTRSKLIGRRCTEAERGGRMIDAILTNTVLPEMSIEYLSRAAGGKELTRVELGVADDEFSYRFD